MKVFITGGTGFIGTKLTRGLVAAGHEVTILTRSRRKVGGIHLPAVSYVRGNPTERGDWQAKLAGHDAVINLAGASVFCRWTAGNKKSIADSRIDATRHLVEALADRRAKVPTLLSASAMGYYGFRGDEELDECSLPGADFLASVCRQWEAAARAAAQYGVRVVQCRFGLVLDKSGGALQKMLPAFQWGLGSPLGSGRQWLSWIHHGDLVNIFLFLLARPEVAGPVNFTAPQPVRNAEFSKILGEVLQKPLFLPPVPALAVKLFLGEFGSVLLQGQRILPRKLLAGGYQFRFPALREALQDLLPATF